MFPFRTRRSKEEHRYYLLAGMGRSNRRRRRQIFRWALVFGALVAALFAALLVYLHSLLKI